MDHFGRAHARSGPVSSDSEPWNGLEDSLLFALFFPTPSSASSPSSTNPFHQFYISQNGKCSNSQNLVREQLELEVMFLQTPPHTFYARDIFGPSSADVRSVSVNAALERLDHRLGVPKLIRYRCNSRTLTHTPTETEANVHQILLPAIPPAHVQCTSTADLLQRSMEYQNLQFAQPPHPALFINLSRYAIRQLVGVPVIPNLSIQIEILDGNGSGKDSPYQTHTQTASYSLWAILVVGSDGKYRSYVREASQEKWTYFSPISAIPFQDRKANPAVERLDNLESLLKEQEQIYKTGRLNLVDEHLGRILYEADCYIYVPNNSNPAPSATPTAAASSPQLELEDLSSRYGLGKGIQGHNNSCYLDVLLFALFYETHVFDSVLLANDRSRGTIVGELVQDQLRLNIAPRLRNPPYICEKEHMDTLRSILTHTNSKVCGEMMDIEEFINNLFTKVLQLEPFIRYTVGTTNFLHQIIVDSGFHEYASLDSLLQVSLASQRLQFAATPSPALIIKMPRTNGVLVGLDFILPTMHLPGKDLGIDADFRLLAVVCIHNRHYTVYVWRTEAREWSHFNSMGPQGQPVVRQLPSLGDEIRSFEQRLREMKLGPKPEGSKHLQRILQQSHLYIYVKG